MLAACGQLGNSRAVADSTAVIAASEQYRQAWIQGDTAAALRYISDNIRILISGVQDITGKAAVRDMFAAEMATYRVPRLTLTHQDLIVTGDYAIDIGIWEETQLPQTGGGAPIHGRGRFKTIWRREHGSWRIVSYMLNDLPPSAAARPK